eukprot:358050-Chlamydomonas_euryale.AAC.1
MPANDVLLPSHGAKAPVCGSLHQHVGRHPGEGTLPTACGLTAVNEFGGHAPDGRGHPPPPPADHRILPDTGAGRRCMPLLLLPDQTPRAAGMPVGRTWPRRRRRAPPSPAGGHHCWRMLPQESAPGRAPGCRQWLGALGVAVDRQHCEEAVDALLRGVLHRHRGVVCKVGAVDHQARQHLHVDLRPSVQPPGQGLCRKEVQGWGEGAPLAHARAEVNRR